MHTPVTLAIFARPDALPESGGLEVWLFERSLTSGGGLVIIGIVLLILLLRGGRAKLAFMLGAAAALVGVGVISVGHLVETDRERIDARTQALVRSAGQPGAGEVAGEVLSDDVRLFFSGQQVPGFTREVILASLRTLGGRVTLRESVPVTTRVSVDGSASARSQVQVRATPEGGAPSLSWWLLDWRKEGDEWRVVRIDCTLLNGRPPSPAMLRGV